MKTNAFIFEYLPVLSHVKVLLLPFSTSDVQMQASDLYDMAIRVSQSQNAIAGIGRNGTRLPQATRRPLIQRNNAKENKTNGASYIPDAAWPSG